MWIGLSDETLKDIKKMWKCKRCGKCCTFIVIPVQEQIDMETEGYLKARGMVYEDGKLYIPAICKYLGPDNLCQIHDNKFANCRLAGKAECKEAQKGWTLLNSEKETNAIND
jgi:Fe-S-cluster containining protein